MSISSCATRWHIGLLVSTAVLLAGGCDEAGISEQRVAEGAEPVPESISEGVPNAGADAGSAAQPVPDRAPDRTSGPSGAQGPSDATGAGPGPVDDESWSLPEGWSVVPGEQPMRLATFRAEDPSGPVEVALTRFPGDVGGELANVNRWRRQIGLAPIGQSELDAGIERFQRDGFSGYRVRMGTGGQTVLAAAVFEQAADRTWFVKATVPDEAADRIEPQVWAFADSIGTP